MASKESERIATLARIFAQRGNRTITGIGDDAAVVRPGGAVIVTSVDAIADGVSFTREHFPPEAIGHKAAAAALSDLAAMGATPGEVYIAAGVPADYSDEEFESLARGIEEAVATAGATASGGDLTAALSLWLSVTVVGYVATEHEIVARDGATPGDIVVVTGELGGSALALEAILNKQPSPHLHRQLNPTPRYAAGRALAANHATAMLDVSDGLARDAQNLAMASNVKIEIDLDKIPAADGATQIQAAESGEEYELLATIAPESLDPARAAVEASGVTLTEIGRVLEGSEAVFLGSGRRPVEVAGYQHFD
jgi:thiamine-monophosphate kinase